VPEYHNPELPQDVNNSDEHPLRSFFALGASALLIGAGAVAALAFFGGEFARFLPYSSEAALIEPYAQRYPLRDDAVETYLQGIAVRLSKNMALPEGMAIRVHYLDDPMVNAFATLGGHVAVFRGLLERVPDENALAMVIAHEIAHAQHRHPIRSLGRGIAFSAAVSMVSTGIGSRVADSVLGTSGMLTLLTFSRAQEEEADETGLAALVLAYGHAGGATDTFQVLQRAAREHRAAEPPKFLSTHPLGEQRIERLGAIIKRSGWPADGARTPIPAAVRDAIGKNAKANGKDAKAK
jgi:predicted Zn-dependent protease